MATEAIRPDPLLGAELSELSALHIHARLRELWPLEECQAPLVGHPSWTYHLMLHHPGNTIGQEIESTAKKKKFFT